MSLQADIQKMMDYVVSCTREFITKNNGGVMPTADEIEKYGESHEFPELQAGNVSATFFVWKKKHVLQFITTWNNPGTSITSVEMEADKWPIPLKLKLAHSIEVQAPDGTKTKIL